MVFRRRKKKKQERFCSSLGRNKVNGVADERSVECVKWAILMALALIGLGGALPAGAMFLRYKTKQVPIDRLFKNLDDKLAKDTNNFELTYDLARLHAMAYSTNLTTFAVRTNNNRPQ